MNWSRSLLPLLAALLIVAGLLSLGFVFLSYGRAPCQSEDMLLNVRLGLSISCFAGALLLFWPKRISSHVRNIAAIALPALFFAANGFAAQSIASRQAACAARSLDEVMRYCGAKMDHFRLRADPKGFKTLTLVAPGTTDAAWTCLNHWADWAKEGPSLQVDESIYAAYRQEQAP